MSRHASICPLKLECVDQYRRLHAETWPAVLAKITECGIRNYSIFLRTLPDGTPMLFSYFEYIGTDLASDGAKMAADPTTQAWWALCKPCMEPLPDRMPEEWWAGMEEVFHND
ncbi:MAG: L-rhamnose mutarotase [Verrucomicrobiota bacterium]|jgi:L-rhamnose mutarotase